MAKQDTLEFKGKVIDLLPNAMLRVQLENNNIITALALNLFYFVGSIVVFYLAFYGARKKGTLVNMGE